MSLFSKAFWHTASRYPGDLALAKRLASLFEPTPGRTKQFTLGLVLDETGAKSPARVSRMLEDLAAAGVLDRRIRVNSPTGGGAGKFDSLADVPHELLDPFTGEYHVVRPEDIEVVFEVEPT